MERSGVSGPRAAQIAAHSTRDKKQTLTREEVLEAHRNVAAEFGNQPRQVVQEARERAQTQERNPDRATRAKEAITYARDSLFEREAVADERLIFRDALRRGMGETTYAEVRSDFEARRQRGDLRSVETTKYASGRSFTTPETIAAERRLRLAIKASPGYVKAWLALAATLAVESRFTDALQAVDSALKIAPENTDALELRKNLVANQVQH
jgi:tetratricopeptide (TPR) repeat protein